MKVYRQGDVWLYPIEKITLKGKRRNRVTKKDGVVLALGEATGHAHRIRTTGVKDYGKIGLMERVITVPETGAQLTHEEHDTIDLPGGAYEVRIQREYSPSVGSVRVYD